MTGITQFLLKQIDGLPRGDRPSLLELHYLKLDLTGLYPGGRRSKRWAVPARSPLRRLAHPARGNNPVTVLSVLCWGLGCSEDERRRTNDKPVGRRRDSVVRRRSYVIRPQSVPTPNTGRLTTMNIVT